MSHQLQDVKVMIESAEAALRNAKKMLLELDPDAVTRAPTISRNSYDADASESGRVIEGIFNGEKMMDGEGQAYPVPANYASKSKLVAGDHLKLTIMADGRFIYKQIGPVARKNIMGTLVQEGSSYKVLVGGKGYRVLLASVTYYKAHVGDKVSAIIPETDDSNWCTLEAVLPGDVSPLSIHDEEPVPEEVVDF